MHAPLFLKNIDKFIGSALVKILPPSPKHHINKPYQKFLFIRPGGIGDAVLLIPAIKAVSSAFPDCHIDILAETRNSGIFCLRPEISNVYNYDKGSELISCVKKSYDVVIDTEQWHRLSAVTARLIRTKTRIGFGTNSRRRLFSHAISYDHQEYEAFSFFRLLTPLDVPVPGQLETPFLKVPDSAIISSEQLLNQLGGDKHITLFPGASIKERRWGSTNFAQLCHNINQLGLQVIIVGGKEDRETGEKILEGNMGINLAGKTTLAETAAVLSKTQLLVSGDSGILHLAVGLDVPTVSLFGPGIADKWAPRGTKHIVINRHLPCSPCTRFGYTRPCSNGAKCIQDITPNEVFQAAASLINVL